MSLLTNPPLSGDWDAGGRMTKSDWISVEDRLPEKCGYFLGYGERMIKTVYFLKWKKRFKVWNEEYCEWLWDGEITHWTQLPPFPEEE